MLILFSLILFLNLPPGLGNVLIRPKLRVKFHNELIPDYHYVSIDVTDFSDYETLANATFDRFEKIKSDKDYLNFILKLNVWK